MTKIVAKYRYQIMGATFFLGLILGILLDNWISKYIAEKRLENYYSVNETLVNIYLHIGWAIVILIPFILLCFVIKFIIFPCERKVNKKQ